MNDFRDPTGIQWGNSDKTYGLVQYGNDDSLVVYFYTKSIFNPAKSKQTGMRQYDNAIFVRMHAPGERLNIIDRPVEESDKRRFSKQWSNFLQNNTQVPDGTPIDLLFPNNPAVADSLKAIGIHTIQQCSKLSANALDTIGMGAQNWKNMAVKYLENANTGAAFLQLQEELEKSKQEVKLLTRQFGQLKQAHDALINQIKNPNTGGLQPGWQPGYDVQAERLDSNHPSQEARPSVKKPKIKSRELGGTLPVVREEDIPIVDLSKGE